MTIVLCLRPNIKFNFIQYNICITYQTYDHLDKNCNIYEPYLYFKKPYRHNDCFRFKLKNKGDR